jgi:hypothetical protein
MLKIDVTKNNISLFLVFFLIATSVNAQSALHWEDVSNASLDGNNLIVHTTSGRYLFSDIANNSASVKIKSKSIIVVEYDYWASTTKSFQFIELAIRKGKLVPLRIDSYNYDNPGQQSFGCSTLFDINKEGMDITMLSIVKLGAMCSNYEFVEGKDTVQITTKKGLIEAPSISTKSTKGFIPVFYADGTLIGRYTLSGITDPSDVLSSSILNGAGFEVVDIRKKSLVERNDIGFYMERTGKYNEAIIILSDLLSKFPERTVAYLNLADAYAGKGDVHNANKNYRIYIDRMKAEQKEAKIPARVLEALTK